MIPFIFMKNSSLIPVKKFFHLQFREREEISRGLAANKSFSDIACALKRAVSTISHELALIQATRETYRAEDAHHCAYLNKQKARLGKNKVRDNPALAQEINLLLAKFHSPQQVAQELKKLYPKNTAMKASHETIYAYVYVLPRGELKRQLIKYLRQHHKARQIRFHDKETLKKLQKQGYIPEMISIEERPLEVADRMVPGHWEGDLIVGKQHRSALGTLVERTTRLTLLVPLTGLDATSVRKAFVREIKRLPKSLVKTLTYDQGKEMAQHKLLTSETDVKVFFAHPHSPWERGTNENTNGLIRQFFPKGTDFNKVSRTQIKKAESLLNTRPRKVNNWRTPYECFTELVSLR